VVADLWFFAKYFFIYLMFPDQPFSTGQEVYMCTRDSEIEIT
jgi:hypothetical protein